MSRIISEPVDRESVEFSLFFENPESKGSGYSFDSDEAGNVDAEKLNEVARANFERMLAGDWPRDVRRFIARGRTPASGAGANTTGAGNCSLLGVSGERKPERGFD
jgi:hypothetical protein